MTTTIDIGKLGTLSPTLGAAMSISSTFGSFMTALERIGLLDFNAIVAVVAAGTGKKKLDVQPGVYEYGLPDLVQPCSDFVTLLANGGKPLRPEGDGTGEA